MPFIAAVIRCRALVFDVEGEWEERLQISAEVPQEVILERNWRGPALAPPMLQVERGERAQLVRVRPGTAPTILDWKMRCHGICVWVVGFRLALAQAPARQVQEAPPAEAPRGQTPPRAEVSQVQAAPRARPEVSEVPRPPARVAGGRAE